MIKMNEDQLRSLVCEYMSKEYRYVKTQEILDSGEVPRLKGYTVRCGKVSDSIFGGYGSFAHQDCSLTTAFDNPPLFLKGTYGERVPLRLMVRSDRISTHDISRGSIPFKDQILAINHNYMRRMVEWAIGTSQIDVEGLDDNSVVIAAEDLEQLGFENVIRAYMAKSTTSTSLYKHYMDGERIFCGHKLPEGLIANGPLPYVMDTPSTKSDEHDESLSPEEMVERGVCTHEEYTAVRNGSLAAFGAISNFMRQKGILLVDTKTEHGKRRDGSIVSQDELFTMDSSRYWLESDYMEQWEKLMKGEIAELNPRSYSKEFARGFSEGDKGYTPQQRLEIALRYIAGIQLLTDTPFVPDMRPREERIVDGLRKTVDQLVE